MQLAAALALISLAAATPLGPAAPIAPRDRPQTKLTKPPRCPGPEFQGCNIDGTKLACAGGVPTVLTCEGGCILNCADDFSRPCDPPTLSYADVTRKHSEQTPEEASAPAVPEIIPTEPPSDTVNISPAASPPPPSRSRLRRPSDSKSGLCGCGAPALANVGVLVAVGAVLGFKAWGLYERGLLGWREVGIGAGIMGGVGAVEAAVGRCLQKKKD